MSQSVVESLMAMGFEQAVAEQAFQATGRSSLELALDWIMQNPGGDSGAAAATDADGTVADGGGDGDGAEPAANGGDGDGDGGAADPDDDGLTAAEGVPNALKCDECGKLLKDAMSAEIHAGRTQHVSFSETTEAIQPLTDEEKAAKVEEIKQRIAERRREREAQEAAERIEREKRRREGGKQSAAMKEELRRKEVERQAIMRRKEKEDDIKARQAIRDKLKAQKEARKAAREAKRNGGTAPAATATAATADPVPMDASPTKVEPAKVYDTARIQVRLTDGSSITNTFEATATISDVYTWVNQERTDGHGMFVLMTSFPRKVYEGSEMATTLAEADLVPSGVLIASAR